MIYTVDQLSDRPIKEGEIISVCVISAANIVKDMREHITNVLGGRMSKYEQLMQMTVDQGFEELKTKATELGYDGVVGIRIAHPSLVQGGVEIIVYGTAFHFQ